MDLRQYINELMVNTGGCASSGFPIASCKIYPDKSYAFLEFRSVEEASNCMAFDGVAYKDSYLRVRSGVQLCYCGCKLGWQIVHSVQMPCKWWGTDSPLAAVVTCFTAFRYVPKWECCPGTVQRRLSTSCVGDFWCCRHER